MRRSLSNVFRKGRKGSTSSPRSSKTNTPTKLSNIERISMTESRAASPSPAEKAASAATRRQEPRQDSKPVTPTDTPILVPTAVSSQAIKPTPQLQPVLQTPPSSPSKSASKAQADSQSVPSPTKGKPLSSSSIKSSSPTTTSPPAALSTPSIKVVPPTLPDHRSPASQTTTQLWITVAVASGAIAALNGAFAKLTTTSQTETIAALLSQKYTQFLTSDRVLDILTSPHYPSPRNLTPPLFIPPGYFEYALRAAFLALNLAGNAAMWALFTLALTRAPGTTQVSLVNTSANFLITALLGWGVFGEDLPAAWFAGAALLVAGNVVAGMGRTRD